MKRAEVAVAQLAEVDAGAAERLRQLRRAVYVPHAHDVVGSALAGLVGLDAARKLAARYGGSTLEARP